MPSGPNVLTADQHCVYMAGHDFTRVHLRDFLSALARKVEKRDATMVEYRRIKSEPPAQVEAEPDAELTRAEIVRQVRPLITSETTLLNDAPRVVSAYGAGGRADDPAEATGDHHLD
jgi:pyruvate decarboxylase